VGVVDLFMLTFSDIYEAMRKEKYSDNLQLLPAKFLMEVNQYFEDKKNFLKGEKDLFSDVAIKNKKKLDNAMNSFRDLLRIRKKKILNLAFVASEVGIGKRDFDNLFPFEKDLFENLVKALEKAGKSQSEDMNPSQSANGKHKLVRFLEDTEEFLGTDGEEIGPFSKGEIANLDSEVVSILESGGKVEIIDY
jgi:hypothetical protein